jgi:hypothetical protein
MAKQTCKGGCRLLGYRYSIPRRARDSSIGRLPPFVDSPQQCAIAAAHHGEARLDQTDGPGAEIVRFPAAVGNPVFAKQARRDLSITISFQPSIQRTHR